MRIAITNLQSDVPLPTSRLRTLARAAASRWSLSLSELSVAFVDDAEIARVNWQFLRHRGPTDVITFNYNVAKAGISTNGHAIVGEIIISAETARAHARRFRRPLTEELARYLAHGLLHLAGHKDKTPTQRRAMRRAENELLEASASRLQRRRLQRKEK